MSIIFHVCIIKSAHRFSVLCWVARNVFRKEGRVTNALQGNSHKPQKILKVPLPSLTHFPELLVALQWTSALHRAMCLPQYVSKELAIPVAWSEKVLPVTCAARGSFPKAMRIKFSPLYLTLKILTDGWISPSFCIPTFSLAKSCLHESKAHCEMFFDLPFVLLPGGNQKQHIWNAKGLPNNCVSLPCPSGSINKSQDFPPPIPRHLERLDSYTVPPPCPSKAQD